MKTNFIKTAACTTMSLLISQNALAEVKECTINAIASSAVAANGGVIIMIKDIAGNSYGSDVVLNKLTPTKVVCYDAASTYYWITATPINGFRSYSYQNGDNLIVRYPGSPTIVYPGDFPGAPLE